MERFKCPITVIMLNRM